MEFLKHSGRWGWANYRRKVVTVKKIGKSYYTNYGKKVNTLTFSPIKLYVTGKDTKDYTPSMKKYIGKRISFITTKTSYFGGGYYWSPAWLSPRKGDKLEKIRPVEKF